MIYVFLVFTTLQVVAGSARALLPFLPTDDAIHVSDVITRRLDNSAAARRPRNVMSLLGLLWPQVVGPIENGIIKEEGFDEMPKTPLENQLEQIRARSRAEVATRQHVRDMLNHGEQLPLSQLHELHRDMSVFFGHPHLHHEIQLHPDVNHPAHAFDKQLFLPGSRPSGLPQLPLPPNHPLLIFQNQQQHLQGFHEPANTAIRPIQQQNNNQQTPLNHLPNSIQSFFSQSPLTQLNSGSSLQSPLDHPLILNHPLFQQMTNTPVFPSTDSFHSPLQDWLHPAAGQDKKATGKETEPSNMDR